MNDLIIVNAELTMTSREIAELAGKAHSNVMRDIRAMMNAFGQDSDLNPCCKSTTYTGKDGRQYEQYELDKDTCLTLLLGYDAVARMKVVKRWQELEAKAAPALNLADPAHLRSALLSYTEKVIELESKVAEQAPKAAGFDRIANATGLLTLRETATTLQVPERKYIQWSQRHDWLYRRAGKGTLLGYAERIKQGYLAHKAVTIHNDRTGEDEIREQVRVTPLGLTVLAQHVNEMMEVVQ